MYSVYYSDLLLFKKGWLSKEDMYKLSAWPKEEPDEIIFMEHVDHILGLFGLLWFTCDLK